MYYIYMHTNKINGKKYIGMTNDIKRRWRRGGVEYKSSTIFSQAIKKYGFDNFKHEIIDKADTFEKACELEKFYISKNNTTDNKVGYNISPGGNGGKIYKEHPRNMLGKHQTEYQKEHQKGFMSDCKNNPMLNGSCKWGVTHKHPKGMKGKHHTEEHNKQLSEKMKGRVNNKPIKVIYPSGEIEYYNCTKDAEVIGLTKPVILKIIRSGKPYQIKVINQYTDRIKHLEGIEIKYLENTEITK